MARLALNSLPSCLNLPRARILAYVLKHAWSLKLRDHLKMLPTERGTDCLMLFWGLWMLFGLILAYVLFPPTEPSCPQGGRLVVPVLKLWEI